MTIHAAKGLEFPAVFIMGLEEGVFPHLRSIGEPDELEEERRLAYVAITRAQERLYLSHAWSRTLYGGTQYNPPSRFLDEIPERLVRGDRAEAGQPRRPHLRRAAATATARRAPASTPTRTASSRPPCARAGPAARPAPRRWASRPATTSSTPSGARAWCSRSAARATRPRSSSTSPASARRSCSCPGPDQEGLTRPPATRRWRRRARAPVDRSAMSTKTIERAALVIKRDLTLGTLFDRLEKVHGDRQLVDGGRRRPVAHLRPGRRAGSAAGPPASPPRPSPATSSWSPPPTATSSSSCAARRPGPGRIPAPVNDQMRKDEIAHVVSDSGATLVLQDRRARSTTPTRPPTPTRPSPTTWPRSSTRRAPPASPRAPRSPTRRSSARWPARCCGPTRLHRDEAVIALPVAHIMGFATLIGLAVAGIPVLPAAEVQPGEGARRHRGAAGDDVRRRARHVPDARRGPRRRARPHLGAGVGVGRRRHAAGAGRAVQEDGRHRSPCRCSAPWARRCSPRATAWSRSAAAWPPRCRRRSSAPASGPLGEALGFALPGYEMRVVDEDGAELKGGEVGELQVKGPGVLKAYWGDEAATGRGAHRGRLAPHRRPRPQGSARAARVRGPPEARDQARRLQRLRPRGGAGARAAPRRARGQRGRPARRPPRRDPGRGGAAAPTAPRSTPAELEAWADGAPRRLQGARSAGSRSTSCPAPAPTRSRRPSWSPCSTELSRRSSRS